MRPLLSTAMQRSLLALTLAMALPAAAEQTWQYSRGEYRAVTIEAEDAVEVDERWTFTDATTPQTSPDPDGNHSDGAVGGVYLELLPDNRVTRDDEDFPPGTPAYGWSNGGDGPQMSFTVKLGEPGRWYVHGRAYHTGSEDNGIHVGLNGEWPASGKQMQWCEPDQWAWSSQQRGVEDGTHCGLGERTIWLDVPVAGEHTVTFSAREDGFELDRFMLVRDLSDGSRECLPDGEDSIICHDGVGEAIDGFVDVGVDLKIKRADDQNPSRRDFVAVVTNADGRDAATLVSLDVPLGGDWTLIDADERCTDQGELLVCALGDLEAGATTSVGFTLEAKRFVEDLQVSVSANEADDEPSNNRGGAGYLRIWSMAPPNLSASLSLDWPTVRVGATFRVGLSVSAGDGDGVGRDVSATLSLPEGVEVVQVGPQCSNTAPPVCDLGTLHPYDQTYNSVWLRASEPAARAVLALDFGASNAETQRTESAIEILAAPGAVDPDAVQETGGADAEPAQASKDDGGGGGSGAFGMTLALLLAGSAVRRRRPRP